MLRKLVEKSPSAAPLVIADATRLPFRDRTFGSAIAAHVLHLFVDWKLAVDELVRVVRPGGVVVASRGAASRAEWQRAVRRYFFDQAGSPPWPPGIDTIEQLDEEMRSRGAAVRELDELRRDSEMTVNDQLVALEAGQWSACWFMDDETRRRAAEATREWARHELGDLDEPRPASYASVWRAYVLP
jgi:ubiquinone/menaquinone biosynthesis C-methylase UbiE